MHGQIGREQRAVLSGRPTKCESRRGDEYESNRGPLKAGKKRGGTLFNHKVTPRKMNRLLRHTSKMPAEAATWADPVYLERVGKNSRGRRVKTGRLRLQHEETDTLVDVPLTQSDRSISAEVCCYRTDRIEPEQVQSTRPWSALATWTYSW